MLCDGNIPIYLCVYVYFIYIQNDGSTYSTNRYYKNQRVVMPLWPLVTQNKPVYQLKWGVNSPTQWSIDNIYIGQLMFA